MADVRRLPHAPRLRLGLDAPRQRLLRFVPTTRKRVIRAAATALLLFAAAAVGLVVGNMGPKPGTAPHIAPTKQPVTTPAPARGDTFPLVPGAPAAPAPAPTRR